MNSRPPSRRLETDREDLMREATALQQRAEFQVPGVSEAVIAGYRRDGSLSVYLGPDPCFHFDAERRLRRAYVDGNLYRTQGDTLARMHRVRESGSVELRRHDLSTTERDAFLDDARQRLAHLADALRTNQAECLREVGSQTHLVRRLQEDLTLITNRPLRLAPPVPGKK